MLRLVWLVSLLAGCQRTVAPRPCSGEVAVELRDRQGALLESLRRGPRAWERCSDLGALLGRVEAAGAVTTAFDARGATLLSLTRDPDGNASAATPAGPRLRLWRGQGELRVLHPDGVPFGSVTTGADKPAVRDAAGASVAFVEPLGRGFLVRNLDGTSLVAAAPAGDATAVGLLALPNLSQNERLTLYLVWSR